MSITQESPGRSRSTLSLIIHQSRYDLRSFWNNTQARFFTILMPVLFLLLFSSIFRHVKATVPGGTMPEGVYYVGSIIAYGVIAASFLNLAINVVQYREAGIYKRRRATPVPSGAIIGGRTIVGCVTALVMAAILLAIGWFSVSAHLTARTLPAFVLTLAVGTIVFCVLGFAMSTVITNADAAQPVLLAVFLPLSFISGIFIPVSSLPHWLADIGRVFPIYPFAAALIACYNPHTTGSGLSWNYLGLLALWGVIGLFVAIRRFSWLPSGE
jgi:ABC-2 type transport system permease protein